MRTGNRLRLLSRILPIVVGVLLCCGAGAHGNGNVHVREMYSVLPFADNGKESAWANGLIAIVYDVHLLGDYLPEDNRDFDGVTKPSVVVGDIINALRRIDSSRSRALEKELSAVARNAPDEHRMAVELIVLLQVRLPAFLLKADGGGLKQRFLAQGFVLKEDAGSSPA